jgi:putative transposase
MGAGAVSRTLLGVIEERGRPEFVRSDNGSEFIARSLMKMLAGRGIACRHIDPGSPWQNGKTERFNGTLRSECTEMETFVHRDQARAICRLFMRKYNHERPHSSLAYQTPAEFARRHCLPAAGSPDIKGNALRLQPAGSIALS